MPQKIDAAVNAAFETFHRPCVVPIIHLSQTNVYLAELFHGPTGSFKDLALQLLPRYIKSKNFRSFLMEIQFFCRLVSLLLLPHEKHVYLVATSGTIPNYQNTTLYSQVMVFSK